MVTSPKRLPVHVLTGFLGSGKTTLLSALLRKPELRDTLVIVNEVGEVGFDHLLLTETLDEVVVQLEGGCACCVVRGDLVRTLVDAQDRLAGSGSAPFSRVVIETSGLATPDAIIRTLMFDEKLASAYTLGRIAATFDVVHGARTLGAYAEAQAQLAAAESIVMTKLDLADAGQRASAEARITEFNPGAEVYSSESFLDLAGGWEQDTSEIELPDIRDKSHGALSELTPFPHTQNIQTFTLRWPEALERRRFNEWMSVRLRFHEGQVLRVKGIVHLHDSDRPVFIHGVQQMFHSPRIVEVSPTRERDCHLVFITEGVSREVIERSFAEHVLRDRTVALNNAD